MKQCLKCLKEINSSQIAHYGLHPECFQKWFNRSQLDDFISLQRRDSTSGDAFNFNKQNLCTRQFFICPYHVMHNQVGVF